MDLGNGALTRRFRVTNLQPVKTFIRLSSLLKFDENRNSDEKWIFDLIFNFILFYQTVYETFILYYIKYVGQESCNRLSLYKSYQLLQNCLDCMETWIWLMIIISKVYLEASQTPTIKLFLR